MDLKDIENALSDRLRFDSRRPALRDKLNDGPNECRCCQHLTEPGEVYCPPCLEENET